MFVKWFTPLEPWTEHGVADSPCEFTTFRGEFLGKNIEVVAVEPESGTKLLGPASMNSIYIHNGNIMGVPEGGDVKDEAALKAVENGVKTNIRYVDGLAANAAYKIEEMVVSGAEEVSLRTTISRSISDINLRLDEVALNYITSENKVIDVRGPTFSTLNCRITE